MADTESDSSTEAIDVDDYGKSSSSGKKNIPKNSCTSGQKTQPLKIGWFALLLENRALRAKHAKGLCLVLKHR